VSTVVKCTAAQINVSPSDISPAATSTSVSASLFPSTTPEDADNNAKLNPSTRMRVCCD
jgi:hypothetical protein